MVRGLQPARVDEDELVAAGLSLVAGLPTV